MRPRCCEDRVDPGRSAHIALLLNRDPTAEATRKWSYILATEGTRAGDQVQSFRQGIPDGFIPWFEVPEEEATTLEVNEEELRWTTLYNRLQWVFYTQ